MRRDDRQRLGDILAACDAITSYAASGVESAVVFDAIRMRLIEIGEAVKAISAATLEREPSVPWRAIAGMRDQVAHHYFDTSHAIVAVTVAEDVPVVRAAVKRLIALA